MKEEKLLDVQKLRLYFRTTKGNVQAVDDVDFQLETNQAIVIVGESGCGKSSMAKAILRLLPKNVSEYSGKVFLSGREIMGLNDEDFRKLVRWVKISMVPQAAMNALNPVLRVGDQVAEPLMVHFGTDRKDLLNQTQTLFQRVGVPVDFINRYAFELSGGMRQRVALAMSLSTSPDVIILDEPTSALDVLTQSNIFNLLKEIKRDTNTSFILITHDIATSSELADRVAVMYAGQIVELSDADVFFKEPHHPYSVKLMSSVPKLRGNEEPDFIIGRPPSLINPPKGCRFADRCPKRFARCSEEPPTIKFGNNLVKCWLYV